MMKRNHIVMIVLLGAGVLFPGVALVAPRSAVITGGEMASPVTEPAEIGAWLQRLAGKYRFEGMINVVGKDDCGVLPPEPDVEMPPATPEPPCSGIKGQGDCVAVGTGPGVQCMFNVTWRDMFDVDFEMGEVYELPGGVSNLDPAMELFGLDPGKAGINYLLVDFKGLPEGNVGFVVGDRGAFSTACVNGPALFLAMRESSDACKKTIRLDVKPDSRVVHWSMDIELLQKGEWEMWTRWEMTLRRITQEEAEGTTSKR